MAEQYRRFARVEAAGRSAAYEALAEAVARDRAILAFLAGLPPAKRQPNLLFAAARLLLGCPAEPASLRGLVGTRGAELRGVMLSRRTQTNEAARCAVLLPALALLPGPLALVEVGAAAGLTLLVDRFSYDYGGRRVAGRDPAAPVLSCQPVGALPVPQAVPELAWRVGLDLNPLDPCDADDVEWLSCLVWPGEEGRAERLLAAASTARRHPADVRRGDLRSDLVGLLADAPPSATLVVYHSAVLAYLDEAEQRAFADAVRSSGAVWLANEAPGVVPGAPLPRDGRPGFVLVKDGAELLARSDSHGSWVEWFA